MSDGEGDAKKVPKLSLRKPEEEVKRERRQSQLSSEMDSQRCVGG